MYLCQLQSNVMKTVSCAKCACGIVKKFCGSDKRRQNSDITYQFAGGKFHYATIIDFVSLLAPYPFCISLSLC